MHWRASSSAFLIWRRGGTGMKNMKIIYKNVSELVPYEKNPRKNTKAVKYVANSISEFGFKVPIIIDENNVVVCGHTRLLASEKLGLDEVPCIIAKDLTEEQIKAFRLADNKVSEKAEWDFDLLNEEMDELFDFDMTEFGFEFVDEEKNKEDTQNKVEGILNLNKATFNGVGKYDIPQLEPTYDYEIGEIKEWIGFNYVLSDKEPEGKAVHFFLDDYQFQRLWNNPEKYIEKLKRYEVVLTPDFSPYGDMPMATQIFNHYRKHWVGALLQEYGVKVVPTIRASRDERSLEWYLDGEPKGGVVCISSMWTADEEAKKYFMKEFNTMVETLKPEKIYVYGNEVEGLKGNIEYIQPFKAIGQNQMWALRCKDKSFEQLMWEIGGERIDWLREQKEIFKE